MDKLDKTMLTIAIAIITTTISFVAIAIYLGHYSNGVPIAHIYPHVAR